jgi:cytidine deaminase
MPKLSRHEIPDDTARQMLTRAQAAKANTYPTAGKGYAVSALTDKGNIYEGVSYISDTLTLTMHCEMTALANAAIHGEKNIIAITGPNCHMCKQLIWESALHSGIDVQIIMEEGGEIKRVPISSLMQYPWPDEDGWHKT